MTERKGNQDLDELWFGTSSGEGGGGGLGLRPALEMSPHLVEANPPNYRDMAKEDEESWVAKAGSCVYDLPASLPSR